MHGMCDCRNYVVCSYKIVSNRFRYIDSRSSRGSIAFCEDSSKLQDNKHRILPCFSYLMQIRIACQYQLGTRKNLRIVEGLIFLATGFESQTVRSVYNMKRIHHVLETYLIHEDLCCLIQNSCKIKGCFLILSKKQMCYWHSDDLLEFYRPLRNHITVLRQNGSFRTSSEVF